MKKLLKHILPLCLAALMLLVWPKATPTLAESVSFSEEDLQTAYDPDSAQRVDLSAQSGGYTITQAGSYVLSGSMTGAVTVQAGKEDSVHIILQDAAITNPDGAALSGLSGGKIILTLAEGSSNSLADGAGYAQDAEGTDAALYTKTDLTINGSGSLSVSGNTAHGIVTKDSLLLVSGSLSVTAVKDGLRAKDSLTMLDGKLEVTAGSDALVATSGEADQGWIAIQGGELILRAQHDGIQAEGRLSLTGGSYDIITGAGSAGQLASLPAQGNMGRSDAVSGATRRARQPGQADQAAAGAMTASASETEGKESDSYKGIKAGQSLIISGGQYQLDTQDDALHANGDITIENGRFTIASGDDAVHADGALHLQDGILTVTDCYEGLEAKTIVIDAGTLSISARDDGINAADPAGGASGRGDMQNQAGVSVQINGGTITVTGGYDAIDSNGTLTIAGGEVNLTSLSPNGGNAAIDTNGGYTHTGGSVTTNDGSESGRGGLGGPGGMTPPNGQFGQPGQFGQFGQPGPGGGRRRQGQ